MSNFPDLEHSLLAHHRLGSSLIPCTMSPSWDFTTAKSAEVWRSEACSRVQIVQEKAKGLQCPSHTAPQGPNGACMERRHPFSPGSPLQIDQALPLVGAPRQSFIEDDLSDMPPLDLGPSAADSGLPRARIGDSITNDRLSCHSEVNLVETHCSYELMRLTPELG